MAAEEIAERRDSRAPSRYGEPWERGTYNGRLRDSRSRNRRDETWERGTDNGQRRNSSSRIGRDRTWERDANHGQRRDSRSRNRRDETWERDSDNGQRRNSSSRTGRDRTWERDANHGQRRESRSPGRDSQPWERDTEIGQQYGPQYRCDPSRTDNTYQILKTLRQDVIRHLDAKSARDPLVPTYNAISYSWETEQSLRLDSQRSPVCLPWADEECIETTNDTAYIITARSIRELYDQSSIWLRNLVAADDQFDLARLPQKTHRKPASEEIANLVGWQVLNLLEDPCHETYNCTTSNNTMGNIESPDPGCQDLAAARRNFDLSSARSKWRTTLGDFVQGHDRFHVHILIVTLQCVAVSFRRLEPHELFDAVQTAIDGKEKRPILMALSVASSGDLMELCSGLLKVRLDGHVDFHTQQIKQLFVYGEPQSHINCHQTMASICLRLLRRVLQPWRDILGTVAEYAAHPFMRYARSYWKKHYAVGESSGGELPAELMHVIELEVTSLYEQDFPSTRIRRMTVDLALDLGLGQGWGALQRSCSAMGAVPGRSRMPGFQELSLENGARLDHDQQQTRLQDFVIRAHDLGAGCFVFVRIYMDKLFDLLNRAHIEQDGLSDWVSISASQVARGDACTGADVESMMMEFDDLDMNSDLSSSKTRIFGRDDKGYMVGVECGDNVQQCDMQQMEPGWEFIQDQGASNN